MKSGHKVGDEACAGTRLTRQADAAVSSMWGLHAGCGFRLAALAEEQQAPLNPSRKARQSNMCTPGKVNTVSLASVGFCTWRVGAGRAPQAAGQCIQPTPAWEPAVRAGVCSTAQSSIRRDREHPGRPNNATGPWEGTARRNSAPRQQADQEVCKCP